MMPTKMPRPKSRRPDSPRSLVSTVIKFGSFLSVALAILRASLSVAGPQSKPISAFQQEMQQNYEDLFKAAIITGVDNPKGTSMSLEQLLAAANRNGLQRLNDQWLGELIPLRAQLANRANTATCASLWSGSVDRGFVPAIETLDPQRQRLWAEVFDQAALAIIDRRPIRPAPVPEQYKPALTRIMSKLTPQEIEDLNTALADSSHLTPDQQCGAARALYTGIARASRADALTVTRAMLYH
jgi:hypothetical protein